jgi:hypothetical protein
VAGNAGQGTNERWFSIGPPSGVGDLPLAFSLHQNVPNPFNPVTTILYDLPEQQRVTLHVYNVSGRLVRILRNAVNEDAGPHEAAWRGQDEFGRPVASGTYFYRLTAGPYTETRRMVLVK